MSRALPAVTDRITARSPDGEAHHVVHEGPEHLIAADAMVIDLPPAGDGFEWALVHRPTQLAATPHSEQEPQ